MSFSFLATAWPSLYPGFAGVDNPLFFKDNTRMLFGDAKASVTQLVSEFKR